MTKSGLLFDIQRFSVNDGPGIRTTLFFKGCSLRCPWCHNPESISPQRQLNFNPKKCVLCQKCVDFVKGKGISVRNGALEIDFSQHNQNFTLVDVCPYGAYGIFGKEYTSEELLEVILKDRDYYENSGGGVTFSGGEALNQINFLCKLGASLKELGLSICMDVSGFGSLEAFKESLGFTDIYLLDYKLTLKTDYKPLLGHQFDITEPLDLFQKEQKTVILRCPIIPSVNGNEEHFKAIARFSREYSCISYVDILPYHNLIKNNRFLTVNTPKLYPVPDKERKTLWLSWLKKHQARHIVMENEQLLA